MSPTAPNPIIDQPALALIRIAQQEDQSKAALSDAVLQSARAALNTWQLQGGVLQLPPTSERNRLLLPLLIGLLDATQTVAAAVADNAWDESHPIDEQLARDYAKQALRISNDLINATHCPDARNWSLPSMTQKELV